MWVSRVFRYVTGRPPSVWGSIYILVIPLAALAFWSLPQGSFYDSNLTREPGYQNDLNALAPELTSAIRKQESLTYPGRSPLPPLNFDGVYYPLAIDSVTVYPGAVQIDSSGAVSITIMYSGVHAPVSDGVQVTIPGNAEAAVGINGVSAGQRDYIVSYSSGAGTDSVPSLSDLLPQEGETGYAVPNPSVSAMWVSPSVASAISRVSSAGQGDPKEASGLYIRMCYFSAITITTLGFGDITPVTSDARTLVGVEAVLGVVLMGLFLNAVAQRWSRSQ